MNALRLNCRVVGDDHGCPTGRTAVQMLQVDPVRLGHRGAGRPGEAEYESGGSAGRRSVRWVITIVLPS